VNTARSMVVVERRSIPSASRMIAGLRLDILSALQEAAMVKMDAVEHALGCCHTIGLNDARRTFPFFV
jgi:hypothetical protein